MPHCIVEYANPLTNLIDPQKIVATVHHCAEKSGLFSIESIKSRAIGYDHFTSLNKLNFIHVNIRLLSGRSDTAKKQLSTEMLNALQKLGLDNISLTVEITDMHTDSYAKSIVR
ncbi:5-carboxymethyl-2-hydroxymuconate Delta-isomerase [Neptunicella marina]|uniref:5-carboxymethyl-2-hydroxymuconate Delta-isomerase n=1 Tax=Neptunicella marina TaxID=2125989 RepID=A0A8J6M2J3_9ALTE|nr:5-carboxymethyl-2-hydroxymuconate Delta-isomerase [Neptunicella marina]MBC3764436.1 5-carboxymethyl-2-hydroxymuconate Delta-isomerase [Neptunicella marina]